MKKYISFLLALCLLSASLVGCVNLPAGENGLSAYEIAQKNGFSGSEEEWLLSLVGQNGKDGKDGQDGQAGAPGKDGRDGEDGITEDITVIVEGEGDALGSLRYAAAVALRSTVSIVCPNSAGAGVIYRLDNATGEALIITNYHVVYDASTSSHIARKINVFLYGAEQSEYAIPATYLGGSPTYDIAVLHVAPNSRMADTFPTAVTVAADYTVGQHAIAVGNPEAGGISVTAGTVSVLSEYVEISVVSGSPKVKSRLMRYDTSVNGGNSGGGLFNGYGELIGIVNAKLNKTYVDAIGYAIPVSLAVAVAENIIANCDGQTAKSPLRATVGVTVQAENHRAEYDSETGLITLKETNRILGVVAGTPAVGKLQADDILLSVKVDDRATVTVNKQYQFLDELLYARVGSTVTITVLRAGEEVTVTLTLEEKDFSAC